MAEKQIKRIHWIPAFALQTLIIPLEITRNIRWYENILNTTSPFYIIALLFALYLHFQCWKAVYSVHARTTPFKAVVFLFIPFLDIYWGFISFSCLAKGLYQTSRDAEIAGVKDLSIWGIFYWISILVTVVMGSIRWINLIPLFASYTIWILFYKRMTQYANRIQS
ncbi:hypothetical protein JW824_06670 [bacterium]|nr:hypothetical protein [bacterium]RQV95551.1 MAG: hypothetical protein EH221_06160 [bacterium]